MMSVVEQTELTGKLLDDVYAFAFDRYATITQGRRPSEGNFFVHPRRYIRFAEARQDNIMSYETAMNTVPIVSAAIWLKADMVVAYGYTFKYDTDTELKEFQREKIKFLSYWSRYVELTEIIRKISACMNTYGDAFVEKVYDKKSYAEGGWGIKRLKLVHPDTVSIEEDEYGRVIKYVQEPYKLKGGTGIFSPLSTGGKSRSNKNKEDDNRIREAPPHTVVHFKARDLTNATYGNSQIRPLKETINIMLGIEDDIADIIRTTARPLTVWRMGDAEHPMAVKQMRKIASQIMSGLAQGSDIAIDGRVEVNVVESGKNITYVEPFMNHILRQIIAGLGIPDTLFGLGGSGNQAEAEIKLEMFRRRILAEQQYISNKIVNEIFRDIFLFHPNDLRKSTGTELVREGVTYKKYQDLPVLRFNEIEDLSNRRLRVESELIGGAIDMLEAKEEFGRNQIIREDALHPQLQMYLAQARYYEAQAKAAIEALEIQKKQLEVQKKQAEQQSKKPTNTNE